MGCGASADSPASPEHLKEMCDVAAKDMEILCVTYAMSGISDGSLKVAVRTPDCVDSWKQTVADLRQKAADIEAAGDEGTGNKAGGVASAVATGGALGGMLASAAGMVDSVADKVAEYGAAGISKIIRTAADTLEGSIQKLEEPFQQVGKEVISESYSDVLKVFCDFINNYKFANALVLIRGQDPYEASQYAAANKKGISEALIKSSAKEIIDKIFPKVEPAIKKHSTTKYWDSMLDANKSVCEKLRSIADKHSLLNNLNSLVDKLETTTDLPCHITEEIVTGIMDLMSSKEEVLRNDSSGSATHSKKDHTFMVVFSGTKMMESHYKAFTG